jgi:hypothetical protein
MLGGEPRPQRADTTRADDGDADVVLFHANCLGHDSEKPTPDLIREGTQFSD